MTRHMLFMILSAPCYAIISKQIKISGLPKYLGKPDIFFNDSMHDAQYLCDDIHL